MDHLRPQPKTLMDHPRLQPKTLMDHPRLQPRTRMDPHKLSPFHLLQVLGPQTLMALLFQPEAPMEHLPKHRQLIHMEHPLLRLIHMDLLKVLI